LDHVLAALDQLAPGDIQFRADGRLLGGSQMKRGFHFLLQAIDQRRSDHPR
jgi:hypothetical protein